MLARAALLELPLTPSAASTRVSWIVGLLCTLHLSAAPVSARAVTLIYSNDVAAELEPCGCRENPYGGMVRKAGLLGTLGKEALIQVDAGNLLFKTGLIPGPLEKQSAVQARYVLQAHEKLAQDVSIPGDKDFALGVQFFTELVVKSKVKFLAANLRRKNGKAFLDGSVILERPGTDGKVVKIAVIGLVGERLTWPKELSASSAVEAARKEIPRLRKKADFVIAVTHQGFDADQALAKKVSGIDIIVGGHSQTFLQEPFKVEVAGASPTWIVQSSFRNQYVGIFPLLKPEAHRLVGLDAGYEAPDKSTPVREEIKKLVDEFKASVAATNSEPSELSAAGLRDSAGKKYQTFPRCAECHWKQFDFWRKTSHANALAPLLKKQQLRNKACLGCHSVGLADPQGYSELDQIATLREPDSTEKPYSIEDLASWLSSVHGASSLKTEVKFTREDPAPSPIRRSISRLGTAFAPVQCENCHGPGENHPFSDGYKKAVAQTTCLKCHTAEMAPKWYGLSGLPNEPVIAGKLKSISCPAGELEPD